jgi:murein L,D-transpeptidase YcbB/YkuD
MNKIKIKVLTLGIVSVLILSSVPALAEDNTSKLISDNTTIQYENVDKNISTIETSLSSIQSNVKVIATSSVLDPKFIREANFVYNRLSKLFIVDLGVGKISLMAYTDTNYIGYNNMTFGDPVAALQALLYRLGYNVSVDWYFGPQTQAAVIDFQKKHGLAVDGITGPNTWNTMIATAPGVVYN